MSAKNKEYRIEGREKTIYRVVKSADNPFVMIDRRPIDNPVLSFKAKGILTYLMARPDGWEVSVTDLVNHSADGDDSVRSGLKELREAGHMKQTRTRAGGRITGLLIEVYEVPQADFQHVEKPHLEKPHLENPTQVISKSNKNKENNNNHHHHDDADFRPSGDNAKTLSKKAIEIREKYKNEMPTKCSPKTCNEIATYPLVWVHDAVVLSVFNNVRKWSYSLAILRNWKIEGHETRSEKVEKARIKI